MVIFHKLTLCELENGHVFNVGVPGRFSLKNPLASTKRFFCALEAMAHRNS